MQKNELDLSVIIPFKDKAKMTIDCLKSLEKYGPKVNEVLLISNNSNAEELQIVRDYISGSLDYGYILLEYNHPFNYQKINNWAVSKTKSAFIMFLNNDTELVENSRGLLERMYVEASKPDVGVTGCLLLFGGEKTIQHAGVYLRPGGLAEHLYVSEKYSRALAEKGSKRFPYDIEQSRPLSSVTGAVNILERSKFDKVGGYDENFIICGGDVDLCLRMNKTGYQSWYIGGGYILHKESQSRKFTPIPYNDFFWSYLSYVKGFNGEKGDPFLPKITEEYV